MDLSAQSFIKTEKDFTYIEENLDFNFDVKIEEIPLVEDWCVPVGDILENNKNCEGNTVVSYDKLKDGCIQKCWRCFQWFSDSFELIKHNLTHLEIKTEKLALPKTFQQLKRTKRAYNRKIKNGLMQKNDKYKCTKCDISYKRRKDLNKHVKYVHEPKEITCDLCPTKLTNRDALKTHVRNCHTVNVFCDICDSKLKSNSYLHAHMRRVHYDDGKVHSCDICNKIFKSPRYLKIHLKNSHKVESNKVMKVRGRKKRQNKLEPVCTKVDSNIGLISPKIECEEPKYEEPEYEEPITYEIEVPYEIALS